MSKPLLADKALQSDAWEFHRAVFALFGGDKFKCWLCKRARATDAAHVVSKWILGKHRYADPGLARPLCRSCHERQTRHEIDFPIAVRRAAIIVANRYMKVKLQLP